MKNKSISKSILDRIHRHGRGYVFTPVDFLDLGSRDAVDHALSRLARDTQIRRLDRGLYDYPKRHKIIGDLSPTPQSIIRALTRKGYHFLPSGAKSANALGLTNQVPAKNVYYTDANIKNITFCNSVIMMKKASPKLIRWAGRPGADVIQALNWLGQNGIDDKSIDRLSKTLPARVKKDLIKAINHRTVPATWMIPVLQRITA